MIKIPVNVAAATLHVVSRHICRKMPASLTLVLREWYLLVDLFIYLTS